MAASCTGAGAGDERAPRTRERTGKKVAGCIFVVSLGKLSDYPASSAQCRWHCRDLRMVLYVFAQQWIVCRPRLRSLFLPSHRPKFDIPESIGGASAMSRDIMRSSLSKQKSGTAAGVGRRQAFDSE